MGEEPGYKQKKRYVAVNDCYKKVVGGRKGWRLPTIEELSSLIDTTQSNPALPSGHPFQNVQSDEYWSSTEDAINPDDALTVDMISGNVYGGSKGLGYYVWTVRGRQ